MRTTFLLVTMALAGCRPESQAPLQRASAKGRLAEVKSLLAAHVDPSATDELGFAPLHYAARGGHVDVVLALIAAGAPVDDRDARNGWTPLQHAIHKGQEKAVLALLEAGADPEAHHGDTTPLLMAAGYGQAAIVRALLAKGADPRAEAGGVNALWAAAGGGAVADITDGPPLGSCSPETVEALLEKAPDLHLPPTTATRVLRFLARSDACRDLLKRLTR